MITRVNPVNLGDIAQERALMALLTCAYAQGEEPPETFFRDTNYNVYSQEWASFYDVSLSHDLVRRYKKLGEKIIKNKRFIRYDIVDENHTLTGTIYINANNKIYVKHHKTKTTYICLEELLHSYQVTDEIRRQLTINLLRAVKRVHHSGIAHGNVSETTIKVNTETMETCLTPSTSKGNFSLDVSRLVFILINKVWLTSREENKKSIVAILYEMTGHKEDTRHLLQNAINTIGQNNLNKKMEMIWAESTRKTISDVFYTGTEFGKNTFNTLDDFEIQLKNIIHTLPENVNMLYLFLSSIPIKSLEIKSIINTKERLIQDIEKHIEEIKHGISQIEKFITEINHLYEQYSIAFHLEVVKKIMEEMDLLREELNYFFLKFKLDFPENFDDILKLSQRTQSKLSRLEEDKNDILNSSNRSRRWATFFRDHSSVIDRLIPIKEEDNNIKSNIRSAIKSYLTLTLTDETLDKNDRGASPRRWSDIDALLNVLDNKKQTDIELITAIRGQLNQIETGIRGRSHLRDKIEAVINLPVSIPRAHP